jgi:hypothetical protein
MQIAGKEGKNSMNSGVLLDLLLCAIFNGLVGEVA